MEGYSYSSFSSSPYNGQEMVVHMQQQQPPQQQQQFYSSLHSVRKPSGKPWKKPIGPLPPAPPKVYKVEPVNFRDLVQKLTGAPEFTSQPQPQPPALRSVAPPPVKVTPSSLLRRDIAAATAAATPLPLFPSPSASQKLSPSSPNWFSFPDLSPGTLSIL